MAELKVSIVTPDRSVATGSVEQVTAPSVMGEVGILPSHKPLLASLEEGVVGLHASDGAKYFAISGGFLEISNDVVTVLAETAENADDINVERAQAALENATEGLKTLDINSPEYIEEQARLRRASVRLSTARLASN